MLDAYSFFLLGGGSVQMLIKKCPFVGFHGVCCISDIHDFVYATECGGSRVN